MILGQPGVSLEAASYLEGQLIVKMGDTHSGVPTPAHISKRE